VIRLLLLSCVLLTTAAAAELVVRDVRLGVATRPSDFDFTMTSPLAEISGSDAFDGGLSLEGGLRWSFAPVGSSLGLVVGADLAMDGESYGSGGDGLNTLWGKASAGLGWAVADRVTLIGEGLVGYGLSTLKLPKSSSTPAYDADGSAISYEGRVTGLWQFTRTFNAGLMAGWLVASHDLSGDTADLTIDQNGWYAGVVFSWRINDMPQALE
jgi:hypothetical protein